MMHTVETYHCNLTRSLKTISEPITKFGGKPILFEPITWPKCKNCSCDMDFLAQIRLDYPIKLSEKYMMAYMFMCPGKFDEKGALECETWDPHKGANTVILQSRSTNSFIEAMQTKEPEYPDYNVTLKRFEDPLVDITVVDVDYDLVDVVYKGTKIGGVPYWLQSNETPTCLQCGGLMKFAAQLGAALDGMLPADPKEWDKYKFLHFGGDDGIGYLFLCENECSPMGVALLWQCT